MEHFTFKSGCVILVVKHLKEDWLAVLQLRLQLEATLHAVKKFYC